MKHSRFTPVLAGLSLLALAGCGTSPVDKEKLWHNSDYWQRANTTDMIYQRGPKAQQMLNQDIARCIGDLRELERLNALRHALPGDRMASGKMPDPETPEGHLAQWETPERDEALRSEHLDYHDFESCMTYKGWERIKYVPYGVAERAQDTYLQTVLGEQYQSKYGYLMDGNTPKTQEEKDFGDLND